MEENQQERIVAVNIEEQMKSAYIDYAMSVIVSRALPDVRDGLKPVHRRVLFGMYELSTFHNKPYKKSARIVGEILGKFHPHGDTSVYDALVRMAQEWALREVLVDGQGNFGSIDGDSPAAMRYTEARLTRMAEELLNDLDKDTVDHQLNFDDTLEEPTVLPARYPNLIVNGASGIAVGMATNMAPHNLAEAINATIAYIDNREITAKEITQYIKAPDFPTGGTIYGYQGIQNAMLTGRGRIVLRGKATIETLPNGRERIIVTEIPYQVNKSDMLIRTAELVNEKKLEGISDLRDESDREGIRVVYEIKRDAVANVVLNNLYKHTSLQNSFSVNNVALVKGRPTMLTMIDMIKYFVEHRHEVVVRRTKFELKQAQDRAHILEGLLVALDELDAVISLIRQAKTPDEAKILLMEKTFDPTESLVLRIMAMDLKTNYQLSDLQAKAILEMRLQRLTGLERDKIKAEYEELSKAIANLLEILGNEPLRMQIIKNELLDIKQRFGNARRTDIVADSGEVLLEDMIEREQVVVTISHLGYIKRTSLSEYKTQARGGKGVQGGATRNEDFIEHIYSANTHSYILFFTQKGKCYWKKVYEIPEAGKNAKGRAIQNLINLEQDDKVKAYIEVDNLTNEDYINNHYIIFCTKKGTVKKTTLEQFSRPRQGGIWALGIDDGDALLDVKMTNGSSQIMIATTKGNCVRFEETKVRSMGRSATGVRGVSLADETDEVIGMICVNNPETETILVVSENGYGKRSDIEDYRIVNRGGKGVKTINITEKTGALVSISNVTEKDDLMIIRKDGVVIRIDVESLRIMGRATQGVKLIRLNDDEAIASVAKVDKDDEIVAEILDTNPEANTSAIATESMDTNAQSTNTGSQ